VGSHDAMPIASVACTVLHRLGTLPWSSGLMSSRALCRGPRATKHQLLLLTAAVMPLLFSRSCEKRCITRYDAATQSPKYHVQYSTSFRFPWALSRRVVHATSHTLP
jgi:hypothetical protein